ncbi:MAG: ABC transporter permease [Anaerolineae bacterium]
MHLVSFITRRVLVTIPLLIGITLLLFTISRIGGADPIAFIVSERAANDPAIVAAAREKWGLDRPAPEQYLRYVANLARGDFGLGFTNKRPVADDLRQFAPATIELAVAATLFAILFGVPLGVIAALYKDRWPDAAARFISLIGVSMPVFWLALVGLEIFYARLNWLPGVGRLDTSMTAPPLVTGFYVVDGLLVGRLDIVRSNLQHLVLPALVLGAFGMGLITRMTRSSVLDVLHMDYVRTARAKGLSEWRVVNGHALRNGLIPVVTVIGLLFGGLLSGAVLTETIFAWPGLGRYVVQAAGIRDYPAVMGATLVIAVMFVVVNLIVDVLYGVLDPRIRV